MMIKITPDAVRFVVQVLTPAIPYVIGGWIDHEEFNDVTDAQTVADELRGELARLGFGNKIRVVRRELVETEV